MVLDAQPELAGGIRASVFEINQVMQKQRAAAAGTRNPDEIPASMRFELREV